MRELLRHKAMLQGKLVRIQERIPTIARRCDYYELTAAVKDGMRKALAAHIVEERMEKQVGDYYVEFRLDLYVLSPEELFKLVQEVALDLAQVRDRMAVMPYSGPMKDAGDKSNG